MGPSTKRYKKIFCNGNHVQFGPEINRVLLIIPICRTDFTPECEKLHSFLTLLFHHTFSHIFSLNFKMLTFLSSPRDVVRVRMRWMALYRDLVKSILDEAKSEFFSA